MQNKPSKTVNNTKLTLWKSSDEWRAGYGKNNSDFVKFVTSMVFMARCVIFPRFKKITWK